MICIAPRGRKFQPAQATPWIALVSWCIFAAVVLFFFYFTFPRLLAYREIDSWNGGFILHIGNRNTRHTLPSSLLTKDRNVLK